MNNEVCKKCGCISFKLVPKFPHIGMYCTKCGAWHRWCSKKEVTTEQYSTISLSEIEKECKIKSDLKSKIVEFEDFEDELLKITNKDDDDTPF